MLICSVLSSSGDGNDGEPNLPTLPNGNPGNGNANSKTIAALKSYVRELVNGEAIIEKDGNRTGSLGKLIKTFEHIAGETNSSTSLDDLKGHLTNDAEDFVVELESLAAQKPWAEALESLQSRLLTDAANQPGVVRELLEQAVLPELRAVQSSL